MCYITNYCPHGDHDNCEFCNKNKKVKMHRYARSDSESYSEYLNRIVDSKFVIKGGKRNGAD